MSLFRDYQAIAGELRNIAKRLDGGRIARDKYDLLISGRLESVPFLIRVSHSETAPGIYIRCDAPADFSLTFIANTRENRENADICRTGDATFDMLFVAQTDNRQKAKTLFAQPHCVENLKSLCCSGKTMLRVDSGTIELSEALIPSNTARHLIAHLESLVIVARKLAATSPSGTRQLAKPTVRGFGWAAPSAAVAMVVLCVAGWMILKEPAKADANPQTVVTSGIVPEDRVVIPNWNDWNVARESDLNPDFVSWLGSEGATPETRIPMDPHGDETSSGVAYLLKAKSEHSLKRMVWIVDRKVLCDIVGPLDGIARIPKADMSRITWAEGSAPVTDPEGDGLLLVRSNNNVRVATVYYIGQNVMHTAVPAQFDQITLR